MSFKRLACVAALAAMTAASVHAQPAITAVDNNDGTATIRITPDAAGLPAALAVELAITLSGGATLETGTVGDVTISEPLIFDTPNPGDSPFVPGSPVGGDATGITVPSATEIFISYGSAVIATPGVIDLIDIDFSGSGMLTVASDSLANPGGDVVAQGGGFNDIVNIAEFSIAISSGAPAINGDFDMDGDVDGADLGQFAFDFANSPQGGPPFVASDFDMDGNVDGGELGEFAFNFVNFPPSSSAIPEPTTLLLAGLAAAGFSFRRNA